MPAPTLEVVRQGKPEANESRMRKWGQHRSAQTLRPFVEIVMERAGNPFQFRKCGVVCHVLSLGLTGIRNRCHFALEFSAFETSRPDDRQLIAVNDLGDFLETR